MTFDPSVHVEPFRRIGYHAGEDGHVVWRTGTGGNCELLHIKAADGADKGAGLRLLCEMLRRLRVDPPYSTVFGFTREKNKAAQRFYTEAGFALSYVEGVYADGVAVVFSAKYDDLRRKHLGDYR